MVTFSDKTDKFKKMLSSSSIVPSLRKQRRDSGTSSHVHSAWGKYINKRMRETSHQTDMSLSGFCVKLA